MDTGIVIWGLAKKALSIFLTLIMIFTVSFYILYVVPGDPSHTFIPRGISPEVKEEITEEFHLDDPLAVQYWHYVTDYLTGDFRITVSFRPGIEINDFIWEYAGWTMALLSGIVVFSIAGGSLLALVAARSRGRSPSKAIHLLSLLLLSVPAYALGILLLMLSEELNLGLPLRGHLSHDATYMENLDLIVDALRHALLPILTGTLSSVGLFVLLARAGVSESLERAGWVGKGTPDKLSMTAVADGLFLIRPFAQFYIPWSISILIFVEVAFNYEGLGTLAWDSLYYRDHALLMACVFLISLIVLVGNCLLSVLLTIAREASLSDALSNWVHEDRPGPEGTAQGPKHAIYEKTIMDGLKDLAKEFPRSASGLIALVVLLVLLVLGLLAPFIGVVSDPRDLTSWEMPPNPRDPSFEESPDTGLMHPLGTDAFGRDVYSLWLHSARNALLAAVGVSALAVFLGVLVGIASAMTTRMDGLLAGFFDFVLTIPARTMLAIPLLAFLVALLAVGKWGTIVTTPYMVLAMYAWAWMVIARRVRLRVRATGADLPGSAGIHRNPAGAVLPTILSSAMLVSKFVAVTVLLAQPGHFLGLGNPTDITWGGTLEHSFAYGAYTSGDWHLVVPQLLGIFLVVASVFVVLDRVEMIARSGERRLIAGPGDVTSPPVIAPAGQ